jgi:hypothetical protein
MVAITIDLTYPTSILVVNCAPHFNLSFPIMSLSMSSDAERWFNNRLANYSSALKSGQGMRHEDSHSDLT